MSTGSVGSAASAGGCEATGCSFGRPRGTVMRQRVRIIGGAIDREAAMRLEGRVAVVTGGGKGIGRAIARRFAAEGAKVVIAQRDPATLERTAREIGDRGGVALAVPTDVS